MELIVRMLDIYTLQIVVLLRRVEFKVSMKDIHSCQGCHSAVWNNTQWMVLRTMPAQSEKQTHFTANSMWFSKCAVGHIAHRNRDQPMLVSRDRVLDLQ